MRDEQAIRDRYRSLGMKDSFRFVRKVMREQAERQRQDQRDYRIKVIGNGNRELYVREIIKAFNMTWSDFQALDIETQDALGEALMFEREAPAGDAWVKIHSVSEFRCERNTAGEYADDPDRVEIRRVCTSNPKAKRKSYRYEVQRMAIDRYIKPQYIVKYNNADQE